MFFTYSINLVRYVVNSVYFNCFYFSENGYDVTAFVYNSYVRYPFRYMAPVSYNRKTICFNYKIE